jgi:AmmeMemoRadiSam system protein B
MSEIRHPAVSDMFYSGNPIDLENQLKRFLSSNKCSSEFSDVFGIIAPHAGYMYSGNCAAHAYSALSQKEFETAIILSPSHREYFYGVSIFNGDAYKTPLGLLEIDKELRNELAKDADSILLSKHGHGTEHAVEVHLPFLQMINKEVKIVPMVIGDQRKEVVDELAISLSKIDTTKTIVIASTDLSHFYPKEIASQIDNKFEERINNFEFDELQNDLELKNCEACGGGGVVAMMKAANILGYCKTEVLSHTDSGDVSDDNSSVVGYLSAVIYK